MSITFDDAYIAAVRCLGRIDAAVDALAEYQQARIVWLRQSPGEASAYAGVNDDALPLGAIPQPELDDETNEAIAEFECCAFEIVRVLVDGIRARWTLPDGSLMPVPELPDGREVRT